MTGPTERCPTCGFNPATVSPADAVAAARSYPRRWRALLVRPDDDDPAIVRRRPSSGEPSALELAAHAAATFTTVADSLRRVQAQDAPDIQIDPAGVAPTESLAAVLERLTMGAETLAGAIDAVRGKEWERTGAVTGAPLRAVDVARHGVHRGIHNLRRAERVIDEVRPGGASRG
ncbi:MAG: hypothetical protein CYG61_07520 [Actinobacteria bacterium]|nr:MAG: hypothetical protein CYG61_07520 [Actinomycetota bacterium]